MIDERIEMEDDLLIWRQGGQEIEEGFVVIVETENIVSVGGVNAGASEVNTGDFVAGILHETPELVPAPSSAAESMNQNEVWRRRHHFLLLPNLLLRRLLCSNGLSRHYYCPLFPFPCVSIYLSAHCPAS